MVKTRKKGKWDKIIINIPAELLREFDRVAGMQYFSRSEAIKQAMRQFIINTMPEDYVSPNMREDVKQQAADAMEAMGTGLVKMAGSPEIQKIDAQNRLHQQQVDRDLLQQQGTALNTTSGIYTGSRQQLPYVDPQAQKIVRKSLDKTVGLSVRKKRKSRK